MKRTMNIDEALNLSRKNLEDGNPRSCAEITQAILEKDSNNTEALILSGLAAEAEGDRTSALQRLTTAAEIAPHKSEAYEELARILSEIDHWKEAAQCLRQALTAQKNYLERNQPEISAPTPDNNYRQIEAITQLIQIVKPRIPLPPLRHWAISPDFGLVLIEHVLTQKPRLIVDLGSGASTLISGYLLEQTGTGRVVALDHDTAYANKTRRQISGHQLDTFAEVRDAPLTDFSIGEDTWQWYDINTLSDIDNIDFLVVDGPPASLQRHSRLPALEALRTKLTPRACILLDDANRSDERAIVREWLNTLGVEYEVVWYPETEKGAALIKPID